MADPNHRDSQPSPSTVPERRRISDRRRAYDRRARERRAEASQSRQSLERLRPLTRPQRLLLVLLTYVLVTSICCALDLRGFDYFEQYAEYVRQGVFQRHNPQYAQRAREDIALILIRDETFGPLPGPPIPRNLHAGLIRDLTRAGARVIAFDLIFDLQTAHDPELAAAARASGKVVWATLFESHDPEHPVLPVASLLRASPQVGHIEVPPDPDILAVNSIDPVIISQGRRLIPSLSLEAARVALGIQKQPLIQTPDGWQSGPLLLPRDQRGRFRIAYLGLPGEVFRPSYYENVYGHLDAAHFRNKVVLIGDVTTVGDDHRFTPVGDMSGVEMHAHAIADMMQGVFMRVAPQRANLVLICLLGALIAPLSASLPLPRAVFATAALLFLYGTVNIWLYIDQRILLHWVGPSLCVGLTSLGILIERALIEEREKRRLSQLLSRYVSSQIAAYVLANPSKCFLGGDRVTATVLFSDIRDFTALSELLTPEEAVVRLNEYLQAMADAVFRHGGTVDKYIGDGIMALFGVPVPHPDHALRAVLTALDMQTALLELRERWSARGLPLLEIGIGINTGQMIVGNIGASQRQDFTVVGDAVNTASRVEDQTRELHKRILITDTTYELVKDHIEAVGPLEAWVKGKVGKLVLYEVRGPSSKGVNP